MIDRSVSRRDVACLILVLTLWNAPESRAQDPPPNLINPAIVTAFQPKGGLNVSLCGTTYIGFKPGSVSVNNWWGIGTGNFVPGSSATSDYGYWGWDNDAIHNNINEVHGDSLFGWWPYRHRYAITASQTLTDDQRPWWALDTGNNANYVINQGAGKKRTFGVVGVWHRDNGNTSGGGVNWAPLSGTYSLWCGLRRQGDNSFVDPITGNPFNANVLQFNDVGNPSPHRHFPGYASQWDQMAYRDVNMGASTTLQVRFKVRTNMSIGMDAAPDTRTGWFDKDPLAVLSGNFISSSAAGVGAPIDSFMVYVGAPVNDASCIYSDGVTRPVFDRQRRWFSEVVRANEAKYKEIYTTYGDNAAMTITSASVNTSTFGSVVRVVFRSKTNRGFDDEFSGPGQYHSSGAGAAVIDDVQISIGGGGFTTLGDFESASQVDNSTLASQLTAWKTTGKPPAVYFHPHDINSLVYEDIAGPVGSPARICKMDGVVISAGDHDQSEAAGGLSFQSERELDDGMISPTINLRVDGGTNAMGLNSAIAGATEFYIAYDVYTGIFDLASTGNAWKYGWQAYPASDLNGSPCWGDVQFPSYLIFDPVKQCFQDREPAYLNGLLNWDPALAVAGASFPDSLRFYLGKTQECFKFGVPLGCSPTDGCYFDDVALVSVTNPSCLIAKGNEVMGIPPNPSGPLSADIWQWVNDTFTVDGLNRNVVPPGTVGFDTTSALVKTGLNIAQATGNTQRFAVPGDTTVCVARGASVRVDLVFRINPGPGNYVSIGNPNTSLRRVPISPTAVNIASPTGSNFWEEYLIDNGVEGTPGGHPPGPVNGGKRWDSLVWNSARCDTAEQNFWPIQGRGLGGPAVGLFASMYAESDPKFTKLGINKNRCFLKTATSAVTQANTVCDIGLTDGWPITAGYVTESGLPLGHTYEYTKIFPDGLFTPGTHVEYYLRREDSPIGSGPFYCPDPSTVFPQYGEGSLDAHRWQEFSVLPDEWKKPAYGGLGQACMLYLDMDDRRGDERVWVSVADSIGATRSSKFGAHNGWFAGDKVPVNDPANFVEKNEQPGTTWDMFGEKASESLINRVASLGAALANQSGAAAVTNKWSFQGPSPQMLKTYYQVVLLLSGDLSSGVLGPYNDFGNGDVAMLQDFMSTATAGTPRGVWIEGEGFVESADALPSNASLLTGFLYTSLRDPSYTLLTGNTASCIDLPVLSPITANGDIYGIQNDVFLTNDVLLPSPTGRSVAASLYSPGGVNAPVVASVYHPSNAGNGEFWASLVDGWDITSLRSRFCDKTHGRLAYSYNALTNVFGNICTIVGSPAITTDVPNNSSGQVFVDFMGLENNPLRAGSATIEFGLASTDQVEVRVYDLSGRLVRVLARRQFTPGRHTVTWDGTDDRGGAVARGVYFMRVRYLRGGFDEAKKLIVLR